MLRRLRPDQQPHHHHAPSAGAEGAAAVDTASVFISGHSSTATAAAATEPPPRPWTSAERGLLADLAAQECRMADIAAGLGRTAGDCSRQLQLMREQSSATSCRPGGPRPLPSTAATSHDATAQQQQPPQGDAAAASPTPAAKALPWRLGDDLALVEQVATHGPQWTLIAERYMTGRSPRALMRRWALIESLMVNATAVSHLDGTDAATPAAPAPGPSGLRDVLQRHHDASANRRGSKASSASSHQRVAAALLGGHFGGSSSNGCTPSMAAAAAPSRSPVPSCGTSFGTAPSSLAGGSSSIAGGSGGGISPNARSPRQQPAHHHHHHHHQQQQLRHQMAGVKRGLGSPGGSPPLRSSRTATSTVAASTEALRGPLSDCPPTAPAPASVSVASNASSSAANTNNNKKPPPQQQNQQHAEMTGEDIVDLVHSFVERHALDSSAAAAAPGLATGGGDAGRPGNASARRTGNAIAVAEQQQRAAAAASVAEVMGHLELHRPQEQTQRVALELSHSSMAATSDAAAPSAHQRHTSELVTAALLPTSVLGMDCDEGAEVAAARHREQENVHRRAAAGLSTSFDDQQQVAAAGPRRAALDSSSHHQHCSHSPHRHDHHVDATEDRMRGAASSLRPPEAEEVQAVIAMHIHNAVEASSLGAATATAPRMSPAAAAAMPHQPPQPLHHQEPPAHQPAGARGGSTAWLFASHSPPQPVAGIPVAGYDDDAELRAAGSAPGASTIAKASTAAFLASWANLEMCGAFTGSGGGGGSAWANVFEPQRCMLRSAVPRALAFLPCAYLSCTGGAAAAAGSSAAAAAPPPPQQGSSAAAFGDAAGAYTITTPSARPSSLTGAHGEGRASLLCPVHVANRFRAFTADMRAALAVIANGRAPAPEMPSPAAACL